MRFVHIKQIAVKSAFFRSFTVKNMLCEPVFETDPQSVYPHYRYIFVQDALFAFFTPKAYAKSTNHLFPARTAFKTVITAAPTSATSASSIEGITVTQMIAIPIFKPSEMTMF